MECLAKKLLLFIEIVCYNSSIDDYIGGKGYEEN